MVVRRLPALETLLMSDNQLTKVSHVRTLLKLQTLSLDCNQISTTYRSPRACGAAVTHSLCARGDGRQVISVP